MRKIEILSEYAEVIKKMNTMDSAISIVDENGVVIQYIPPTNLTLKNIEIGSKVQPGSAQAEAWETRKEVRRDISSSVFGIALRAVAIPIFAEKIFIGVVAAAINLEAQEKLYNTAQSVAASTQEIGATTEEVASTSETLSVTQTSQLRNNLCTLKIQ